MDWINSAKKLVAKATDPVDAKFLLDTLFDKLKNASGITKSVILKHLIPILIGTTLITSDLINKAANNTGDADLKNITQEVLYNKKPTNVKSPQPNWDEYAKDADSYLKFFPGTPLTGELMARAAKRTYDKTGTLVPVDLALAQGQAESSLGTDPRHRNPKTNPWSVGEDDDKTTQFFKGIEHGTQAYYNLTAKNYLRGKSVDQLLSNFVNTKGQRYATDKQYEKKMKKRIDHIRDYLNRARKQRNGEQDMAKL
jgi:hypothetical protein